MSIEGGAGGEDVVMAGTHPGAICNRQVDSHHTYLAASGLDTDSCGAGWEALVNDGTGVQAKGAAA